MRLRIGEGDFVHLQSSPMQIGDPGLEVLWRDAATALFGFQLRLRLLLLHVHFKENNTEVPGLQRSCVHSLHNRMFLPSYLLFNE